MHRARPEYVTRRTFPHDTRDCIATDCDLSAPSPVSLMLANATSDQPGPSVRRAGVHASPSNSTAPPDSISKT